MTDNNQATSEQGAYSYRLGVVLPLGSEEETIEQLLVDILAQLDDNDRIFCVLDEVSKDQTRALVQQTARKHPRVTEVWAPENRCVVDAYFCGYRQALAAGCQWILEMDGGYSHDPKEIPRFIRAMAEGIDFAAGSRFVTGGGYSGPWKRNFLSKGGSVLANLLLGTRMQDMTSGFECFSHQAMQYVVEQGVQSRAHFFQTEIRFMLRQWNWVEVPIQYSSPSSSVGSGTVIESIRNLLMLARQARR